MWKFYLLLQPKSKKIINNARELSNSGESCKGKDN